LGVTHEPARVSAASSIAALAVIASLALSATATDSAGALSLSPLKGTIDASPRTQISFLGIPEGQITHVSVVGSRTRRHVGRLARYASAAGASFLPAHPFAQGELVRVSAIVGPRGHARQVSTSFRVAHAANFPIAVPARKAAAGRQATAPEPATVQSFLSQRALRPPSVQIIRSSPVAAGGDVFLAPSHGPGQSGPMIIDEHGQLVWFQPAPNGDVAEDLQVQSYEGQPVLVWWQGYVPALGVGFGRDVLYNSRYQQIATVAAGNGYWADLHDIQLTPQGSAFITAYTIVRTDLSSGGGSHYGTLADAVVQQVDIKTGLVMFEWHALGHVALSESYALPTAARSPWDYIHLNSISLDPWGDGNFLVSGRNTWAAYEIDHHTGAIRWRLGGKRSSFRMGAGTGVAWQHDARWLPDGSLTIFDNGSKPKVHTQSRAIRERIDRRRHAVALVGRAVHSPKALAGSQGNDQVLQDGNSFVGWGEEPYFSEFSRSGQVVFEGRLPPTGQSYRAYRFPWSATSASAPAVAVSAAAEGVTLYASWNGATGVSAWRALAGASAASLTAIATAPRGGFETAIPLQSTAGYFAAQALGPGGEVLATSPAVPG
jgi:hypothetical protein